MTQIAITGASGVLGRALVQAAADAGHRTIGIGRGTGGPGDAWRKANVATGAGLEQAVRDADIIIHSAASPMKGAAKVEVEGLARLRDAAPDARIIYPSIVGVEQMPHWYYATKWAAEQWLQDTDRPAGGENGIVRITQFHEFPRQVAAQTPGPFGMVPRHMRTRCIAVKEAARYTVDAAVGSKTGLIASICGPEEHAMKDLVTRIRRAEGRRGPTIEVPFGKFSQGLAAGHNLGPAEAVGTTTWDAWFEGWLAAGMP